MHPTVIFCIDKDVSLDRIHAYIQSHYLSPRIKPVQGSYKGEVEDGFITSEVVFNEYFKDSAFISQQESVLRVSGCNKMYATLIYNDGSHEGIGSMCAVSEDVAKRRDGWTYLPHTGNYYIAARINPDHAGELQ